jgi:hypothetical protein
MLGKSAELLLKRMSIVRRDIGSLLVHWTRSKYDRDEMMSPLKLQAKAADILFTILDSSQLLGSSTFIRESHKCICFTEAPIPEMASLFKVFEELNDKRYEPYGVAVSKEWLFSKGGRPVIYQSDAEYNELPQSMKWRHCLYEPASQIDFTWEREWRIPGDKLDLSPKETLVIVPDRKFANQVLNKYRQSNGDPRWAVVSLDYFGLK